MTLLREIEAFLRATGMKPSSFGRQSAGDPRLVWDLRRGRHAGARLQARVRAFICGVGVRA